MRPASLFIAGCAGLACLALTAATVAQVGPGRRIATPQPPPAPPAHGQYFVDFRARSTGLFGHAFLYYGRIDRRGRVAEAHFAGLYPREDHRVFTPLLPLMFVPGYVSLTMEDPNKDLSAIYRRRLSAAQYAHLKATVRRLKARNRWWHPAFYNCNDFVAHVARQLGLRTPHGLDVPTGFVRALRQVNGGSVGPARE